MSATAFDQAFAPRTGVRQIDARPRGVLAAAAIGGAALCVLLLSLLLPARTPVADAGPAAQEPQSAAAPAAPGKITTAAGPIGRKYASFDLSPPEFAKEAKSFTERSLDATGGREESVIIGQFAQGATFLRLDLVLSGGDKIAPSDFFLDMTRHAQQAGLAATRIGQPSPMMTRFGNFEVADIKLSQDGEDRACLAARFLNGKAPLEIAGVACGAAAHPIDRRALACILDRLDYLSNGENKAMDEFFLTAELDRGKGCVGAGGMTPNASPKSSWLDGRAIAPPLKKNTGTAPVAPPAKHKKKAAE
jgi:hypothetical protein